MGKLIETQRFIKAINFIKDGGEFKSLVQIAGKIDITPQVLNSIFKDKNYNVRTEILSKAFSELSINPNYIFKDEKPILLTEEYVGLATYEAPENSPNKIMELLSEIPAQYLEKVKFIVNTLFKEIESMKKEMIAFQELIQTKNQLIKAHEALLLMK